MNIRSIIKKSLLTGRLFLYFFVLSVFVSCNRNGQTKSNHENKDHSVTLPDVREYEVHGTGRLANQYGERIFLNLNDSTIIFTYGSFRDTCRFTSLSPDLVFYSERRNSTFQWHAKEPGITWELTTDSNTGLNLTLLNAP
jgi:hypothetical protein